MRAIGERLREVRGERTLAEFTQRLGLARTTWSNYEAGRRLPSHEVMQLLERVEGVPPDRILPSAELTRTVLSRGSDDWWSYIPVLWLFSRLKGARPFASDSDELTWWAEHLPALADEFAHRTFELAEKRDLSLDDAAHQVCAYLQARTPDELFQFVDSKE
ncbi:helix-turn-helix domain-containing protein [Gemmobacter sp. LW-1]|uniref:helix-turn-helix domain-containing protein n=1 Tax=Gemmobacter sp. LW-1 TaxID=1529005 RepID=UPI0006C73E28|nr:helix-turn-helix transcriptional regulator [Gemmobacter sp. LW-1]